MRKLTLALIALVLAGCGGGNGEDDLGDTGPATTDVPRTGTISPDTGTNGETETDDD